MSAVLAIIIGIIVLVVSLILGLVGVAALLGWGILQRIGAHHVVYPEADAGKRVAHLVNGHLMDFIEFDESFAIVKMRPPRDVIGHSIDYCHPRRRHKVNIVGIKTPGGPFQYAQPETIIGADDVIIVSGHVRDLERFADYSEQKR